MKGLAQGDRGIAGFELPPAQGKTLSILFLALTTMEKTFINQGAKDFEPLDYSARFTFVLVLSPTNG